MYENDNFSGYGTGNENTTGTFSGADLNETRTENSYGYENHSTTQSAAGSTNGYTTYQMCIRDRLIRWAEPQAATIRSLRKPKNMAVTSGRQW